MIFSSYVDRDNEPVEHPVIATIPGRGWNLPDEDFEPVSWATRLLFLACLAANEYYVDGGGAGTATLRTADTSTAKSSSTCSSNATLTGQKWMKPFSKRSMLQMRRANQRR